MRKSILVNLILLPLLLFTIALIYPNYSQAGYISVSAARAEYPSADACQSYTQTGLDNPHTLPWCSGVTSGQTFMIRGLVVPQDASATPQIKPRYSGYPTGSVSIGDICYQFAFTALAKGGTYAPSSMSYTMTPNITTTLEADCGSSPNKQEIVCTKQASSFYAIRDQLNAVCGTSCRGAELLVRVTRITGNPGCSVNASMSAFVMTSFEFEYAQ